MTENSNDWYYNRRGDQRGPMSAEALRTALATGELKPDALVRQGTMSAWIPIATSIFATSEQNVPEQETPPPLPGKPTPPKPKSEPTWYYTFNGEKIGPVPREDIEEKLAAKTLNQDTHVWRKGMAGWTPIAEAGFEAAASEPPPLAASLIGNGIVWTIAFLPVIYAVVDAFLIGLRTELGYQFLSGNENAALVGRLIPNGLPIVVSIGINIGMCLWDESRLRKAGYSSDMINRISALLVPVYLFLRARTVKETPYYGFVWLFSFVMSLLIR